MYSVSCVRNYVLGVMRHLSYIMYYFSCMIYSVSFVRKSIFIFYIGLFAFLHRSLCIWSRLFWHIFILRLACRVVIESQCSHFEYVSFHENTSVLTRLSYLRTPCRQSPRYRCVHFFFMYTSLFIQTRLFWHISRTWERHAVNRHNVDVCISFQYICLFS